MTLSDFHFIRPYWLLALLPATVLFMTLIRRNQPTGAWSEVCDAALLPFILQQKTLKQSRVPLFFMAIATILTIIALAGPTWERLPSPVFSNESALVIVLDLSLSMNTADVKPTRLIRARYKIADILKRRKDGQTALLVYAGDAFTVTPLTNDTDTIDSQLSALTTDIMPSHGSNTFVALQKAVALFKQANLRNGQILLVTDGAEVDKTLPAIESNPQYTLSILAVGTAEGGPIKAAEGDFVKDAQGTIVIPKLNAPDLAKLAQAGQGLLVTLGDDNQDVERLTGFFEQAIVKQEAESKDLLFQQWAEKGPWILLALLPLAALSFRKGLLSLVLLGLLMPLPKASYALEWQDLWLTKDQQAQQAYQKQDFAKAAEQFKNPDWQAAAQYKAGNYPKAVESLKNVHSADGFYNQGNALAQAGQLPEAIKAYEQALKLKPDDADTKANKELVEKELKKQQAQKEQQKQQEQDKKDQQKSDEEKSDQEKSEQNKQDANKDQQSKDAEQKSQQKNQQKPKDTEQSQAKDKEVQKQPEQKPEQAKDAKKAEQKAEAKPDEKAPETKALTPDEAKQQEEAQQANEQWLKRIPDDPAGLLKRKFQYQYGQQEHQAPANAEAW
ncbi:MAG: VWA domain-containing protein [Methylococcaceae bacterium]|nr:VWA domain-containing protein [Methylococcaceae bacterium]